MCTCGSWGAQPKIVVQSVGAKGERVHYLSRQLLPLVRVSVQLVSVSRDNSRNTCYPFHWESKSFGPPSTFVRKDMAMVPTFVFSSQKRMGKVNEYWYSPIPLLLLSLERLVVEYLFMITDHEQSSLFE